MRVAILTANTDIYREKEEDKAGEIIKKILEENKIQVVFMKALPTDRKVLATVMQRLADDQLADLILTTGGAGCAKDDCTPEATLDIVEREVRGIPEALRTHLGTITKRSMLNRGVAGIRKNTLIVNLPGKAGAAKESLRFILAELIHAVDVITGVEEK